MFSKVADFVIIITILAGFYVFSAIGFASMKPDKTTYDISKYIQKTEKFDAPMVIRMKRNAPEK